MLTALGKVLRRLRLERGELLKDMATAIDVVPSYLSSIENGKNQPTEKFLSSLLNAYQFTVEEIQEVQNAYYETINEIRIDLSDLSSEVSDLGLVFARSIRNLSSEQIGKISEIIKGDKNVWATLII